MALIKFLAKLYTTPPLYFWGLVLFAIALPLSVWLMSVSQFLIASYWLLDGKFKHKWQLAKTNRAVLFFAAAWLIHVAGLLWSDDIQYGINDIRIKLPLLILPVFAGTLPPLSTKQVKYILVFFILAVFAGTVVSMAVYSGFTHHEVTDIRDISILISHIRFSLLINVAIVILVYFLRNDSIFQIPAAWKKICIMLLSWFILFLFILESSTGIIILCIIAVIMSFSFGSGFFGKHVKFILSAFIGICCIAGIVYIHSIVSTFYKHEDIDISKLDVFTKEGNRYVHHPGEKFLENGNYISIYICDTELSREWNKRAEIDYNETATGGFPVRYALYRYLTSKGLRKDAEGFARLTDDDIKKIERGASNYKYADGGLSAKIYQYAWQADCYIKGGNPSGHTLTQRIEYLKTSFDIIKNHFWSGTGTGDVKDEFQKQYIASGSKLSQEYRLRAHNQYVTFFLTFGLPGFLLIMFFLLAPAYVSHAGKFFIFNMFFLIALLSMLNEDTLESQPGVSFFMFFYILFAFVIEKVKKPAPGTITSANLP